MDMFPYAVFVDRVLLSYVYLVHGYITCCTNVLKSFAHEELDYE